MIRDGTLTSVAGVEVGHWTDETARTGVTVITFPDPNVAAVEVRGGAPGTRETALLGPGMRIEAIQGLVFSGGSAYGLASADGVVRRMERDGRGHPTPFGLVPIVPAAIIFDLGAGDPTVRPGPDEGAAAYDARSSEAVAEGAVGVGTGASAAVWRGFEHRRRGGLGSRAVEADGSTVGALAVVNPAGDVFTLEGEALTGGDPVPGPPAFPPGVVEQTTLVAVATDARLTRSELSRVIVRCHDAMAVCIRPTHTRFDGDVVFAVSCGDRTAEVEPVAEAAFEATGRAIAAAIRSTEGMAP